MPNKNTGDDRDLITRVLAAIVRARAIVLVVYALLVPAAAIVATRIPSEGAIDQLIVPSDPDFVTTRAFQAIFPEQPMVLLVLESDDPWSDNAIAQFDRAEAAVARAPHVATFSLLDGLRRARPSAPTTELRGLGLGTSFFRSQGLVGDHFMTLFASLDVHSPAQRDAALAAIDDALARANIGPVRKIGEPYVISWIERQSAAASTRGFPIFALLLVGIAMFVFRSARALAAIVIALAAAVAIAVAAGGLLGFAFTIVSVLVPLTILVTTLATLVYLHTRFVDRPDDVAVADHQLIALRNKFRPVTASTIAAAMGFGALAVSHIRPIRQMGIWIAIGLVIAWIVAYTLFPALQLVLRTPTGRRGVPRDDLYERISRALPAFTFRFRWPIIAATLMACAAGVVMLFGVPGVIRGAAVDVDSLANIDPAATVARDLRWFRTHVMALNVAHVWIHLPQPNATDPEVLRAIDQLTTALEATPDVTAVAGPTTMLRMRSYLDGHGDVLPRDPEQFARTTGDLEQLLLSDPEFRSFIAIDSLADLQLTIVFRTGSAAGYAALARRVYAAWNDVRAQHPVLAGADAKLAGQALLQAKVGANLVPTLAESFLLTAALIFVVFLVLFRSGLERLLAMIPSLFALLVALLGMRMFGASLNVATIIIATTVLGTTENDQIHFFHHMHERTGAPLEVRLRHAFHVSGRAIVFATVINAAGFLGLTVSRFPPLRQFGLMTASAFLLALAADFLALPAALWITSREQPEAPPS